MKRKKLIIIALTVTIAVLATMFFFLKPFVVVGESMFPVFSSNERLVAETLSKYFLKIKRGETIVFREPHERKEIFVKRVIGLPGETVRLTDSSVTIISPDGIEEVFGEGTLIGGRKNGDPMEMKLGPEDYFVMGDNREKSTDSRHFGTVQPADIVGRPILRGFAAKIIFSLLTLGEKTPSEAEGAYTIGSSLRFNDDDSAYLSKTFSSAGTSIGKTATFSFWVKRANLGTEQFLINWAGASADGLRFTATDTLYGYAGNTTHTYQTNAKFRDPTAWFHIVFIVDSTQATAADRVRLYINGTQQTFSDTAYTSMSQNADVNVLDNVTHAIGKQVNAAGSYIDGYISDFYAIDGQALGPSYFGVTDGNGYWRPKAYTGTYGTNGFYLPFNDGTNTTTLGYDRSGNGNNWTLNNLATTDQVTDTPTNNYATLSSIDSAGTLSDGNLTRSGTNQLARSTWFLTSGKWYWEYTSNTTVSVSGPSITRAECPLSNPTGTGNGYGYLNTGEKTDFGTNYSYGSSFTNGDILGVAFDADTRTIWFSKNGIWQNGATAAEIAAGTTANAAFTGFASVPWSPSATSNTATANATLNFGQRPFAYTPPTGFKSLNTANLPEPTIVQPNKYFDAVVYTGTGAAQSIGLAGSSFVSGSTTVISFTSSGTWTVPAGVNAVEYLVVAGGGGGAIAGGGAGGMRTGTLAVTPGSSLTVTVGAGGAARANGSNSVFGSITSIGGGAGSDSGTGNTGGSGGGGGYTSGSGGAGTSGQGNNGGNGSANSGGGGGGAGAVGANAPSASQGGNGGNGLASSISGVSVTYAGGGGGSGSSTGSSGGTGGGGAGSPTTGTAGTPNTGGGGGGGEAAGSGAAAAGGSGIVIIKYTPIQTIKFQPDLVWLKDRTSANAHGLFDSVRTATKYISSNSTAAETTDTNSLTAFLTNGFSIGTTGLFNTSGNSYISWNWKKSAISGVDIVSYTGNGTNRTIAHGLGVAPKLQIVKDRDGATGFYTWHADLTSAGYALALGSTDAQFATTVWNSTAPTSANFSISSDTGVNANGNNHIAYLFAEIPGFSRIGKYTGNGSADGPFVWTGFKPKFIIWKRANLTGSWSIHDTARSPRNPANLGLWSESSNAESTYDAFDLLANGFKVRAAGAGTNASGDTHIYAAFAEAPFKYSSASESSSGAAFFLGMSF